MATIITSPLSNHSTEQLVAFYNSWAVKHNLLEVKKFRDRPTTEQRIIRVVADIPMKEAEALAKEQGLEMTFMVTKSNKEASEEAPAPAPEPKAEKAPKVAKEAPKKAPKEEKQPKAQPKAEKAQKPTKEAKAEKAEKAPKKAPKEEKQPKAEKAPKKAKAEVTGTIDKAGLLAHLQENTTAKTKDFGVDELARVLKVREGDVVRVAKRLATAGLIEMVDDRTPAQQEAGDPPFYFLSLTAVGAKFDPKSQVKREGTKNPGRPSVFSGYKIKITKEGKEYPRREAHNGKPSIRLQCWQIIKDAPNGISYEDYIAKGGTRFDLQVFYNMDHVTLT